VRRRCDQIVAAQQSVDTVTDSAFDLLVGAVRPLPDCLLDATCPSL
jgi:hypothetical protein